METRSRFCVLAAQDDPQIVMGDDLRLPEMPPEPTLVDFFKFRFSGTEHLLQSARLARLSGQNETIVTACLLHDIAVCGFIRGDHGYWGEQMIGPYVSEEIAWAVRTHQALRFYPDESVGYDYPERYVEWFGAEYQPDAYIEREYLEARQHRWYMTSRMITVNDLYSFDPDVTVEIEEFTDLLGRNFKQPSQGLGFDNSPCAHLWRSILRPNKFL
jgi:hypothetical protein